MHLHSFLVLIWDNPKLVAKLLMNVKPKNILDSLFPLFANNFYENILSQKFIQNNLLYVITLLLKHEIKTDCDLEYPNKFLSIKSPCGYLLYELRNKRDFQIYLKEIIQEGIELLDEYPFNICLNIAEIESNINRQYENNDGFITIDKKGKLSESLEFEDKRQLNFPKIEELKQQYFTTNINSNNFFNELNQNIINYYNEILKISKDDNIIYDKFIKDFNEEVNKKKYAKKIYPYYFSDFYVVTKFIETLFNNILKKINIIPNSIKIISKIISILIIKKYPNISIIKRNTFICRFFFCALFWPISENSNNSWSVANYLISEQSMNNLLYIEKIILVFIMGELYIDKKDYHFFPFNKFFIEKMDLFIKFIDELINVNLPEFINKTLEDENYIFNYLNENDNDEIINRSICFTIKDIFDIITTAAKEGENIFLKSKKLKNTYEELTSNQYFKILNNLQEKEKSENKLYFYLISDCLFAEEYAKKINIKKKMNYFTLELKKNPESKEEKNLNLINEAKNLLSGLLFNIITLTKDNISKNYQNDFIKLLEELLILSKFPHYSFSENLTTSWYAEPLIKILPKLSNEMRENNYEKLIEGLILNVKNSIKDLQEFNGTLNIVNDEKLNYTRTTLSFIEQSVQLITGIDSYSKVIDIVKKDKINVGFYITNNNNNLKFCLHKNNPLLIHKLLDKNQYYLFFQPKIFKTIFEFIYEFPDFNILFDNLENKDKLDLQEEMDIPKKLNEYFTIINEYLNNKYNYLSSELNDNNEKIYKDIITLLHKKLCPDKPVEKKIIKEQNTTTIPNILNVFFEEVNEKICKNNKYSIDKLNDIKEKLYDYVMEKLYDKLYPKIPTDEEKNFFEKICLYSWLEPKHLNEKYNNRTIRLSFLPDTIKYFKLFIKEKSPRKKIEAMNHLFDIIEKAIEFNEGKGDFGTDDIIPLLTYCCIKAHPFRINSSIKYALLYNPYYSSGIEALRLSQLILINGFINNLSFESLFNITKEEFDKNVNLINIVDNKIL